MRKVLLKKCKVCGETKKNTELYYGLCGGCREKVKKKQPERRPFHVSREEASELKLGLINRLQHLDGIPVKTKRKRAALVKQVEDLMFRLTILWHPELKEK